MTDHVGVRHTELVTHAGHVEAVAERVGTAARAAAATRAGEDAYGKLCVLVPAFLNALQDVLTDGITAAAGSLHVTGTRLRTTAADYDSADQRRASAFRHAGGAA